MKKANSIIILALSFEQFLAKKTNIKTSNVSKVVKVFTDKEGNPIKTPLTLEDASQRFAVLKYQEQYDANKFDANNKEDIANLTNLVQEGAKHIKRAWRNEDNQNSISYNPKYKNRFTCVKDDVKGVDMYSLKLFGI